MSFENYLLLLAPYFDLVFVFIFRQEGMTGRR